MKNEKAQYLLDTNIFIWLASQPENLTPQIVKLVQEASDEKRLFVSQISLWEIALKESIGKLKLSLPIGTWLKRATENIETLSLNLDIIIDSTNLPGDFHKDPADRFIVATARHHLLTLVSSDRLIIEYAKSGFVQIHPVSLPQK